jgi:hypothetical protein
VFQLEKHLGTANGSMVLALLAAVAAAGAVLVSRRGGGTYALCAAYAFVLATSLGSVVNDTHNARQVRHDYLPQNPSWVDDTGLTNVTLLQTVGSPPDRAVEQLYWNRSLTHEALLGAALPTDVYAAPRLAVAANGTLHGVGPNVLLQEYAATVEFANAELVSRAGTFSLWSADGTPRLALLEQGRYADGWLSRSGRLTVWPDGAGNTRGTLRFTLSLPPDAQPSTVAFGKVHYNVYPGEKTTVVYTVDARGPWSLPYKLTRGGNTSGDLRLLSVLSTPPVLERAGAPVLRATATA